MAQTLSRRPVKVLPPTQDKRRCPACGRDVLMVDGFADCGCGRRLAKWGANGTRFALAPCPDCSGKVSLWAHACPHCGRAHGAYARFWYPAAAVLVTLAMVFGMIAALAALNR